MQKCVPRCASLVATCRYTARTGRVFWRREKATIRCEKAPPGDADGISIITAIPRRTVKVRVKGRGPIKKTIVLVRDGDRFFLHLSVPLKVKPLEKVP